VKGGRPPADGTTKGAGTVSGAGRKRPMSGGRGKRVVAAVKDFLRCTERRARGEGFSGRDRAAATQVAGAVARLIEWERPACYTAP